MLLDDSYEPFDPFHIGPIESVRHFSYDALNSPSSPPPVYATWSKPKVHTNRSISEDTLAKSKDGAANAKEECSSAKRGRESDDDHYHIDSKPKGSRSSIRSKVSSSQSRHSSGDAKVSSSQTPKRERAGGYEYASKHASVSSVSRKKTVSQSTLKDSSKCNLHRITPSLKDVVDSLRSELKETIKISKSLAVKASKLSERLKNRTESSSTRV